MAVLTDQREQIVRELTRHCGDGRLTLDELEARIEEAYAAEDLDALRHVLRELPTTASALGADSPQEAGPVRQERFGLPPLPKLERPALPPLPNVPDATEWQKPVGALFAIGGFVLLFNGMFWLALICWFVLPGLVLKDGRCR